METKISKSNIALLRVKVLLYLHLFLAFGYVISAGESDVAITFIFYSGIFLASLVWALEGTDKGRIFTHAQILNMIGLVCDIGILAFTPINDRYGVYHKAWNLLFTCFIMCSRPLNVWLLYKEANVWNSQSHVIMAQAVRSTSEVNTGSSETSFDQYTGVSVPDVHFVNSTETEPKVFVNRLTPYR